MGYLKDGTCRSWGMGTVAVWNIQITDKSIEIIENRYSNGIPITVKQLPYYYKIKISTEEYNQYKTAYKKTAKWKIYKNNEISF